MAQGKAKSCTIVAQTGRDFLGIDNHSLWERLSRRRDTLGIIAGVRLVCRLCSRCNCSARPQRSVLPDTLIEELPASLMASVHANLSTGEEVMVRLKGRFKEALICTGRRVLIVKSGFMTGNTFGSNVFQAPYLKVAGCEVKTGLVSGYFEISTGGMQNTTSKKEFSGNSSQTAREAPNTVALLGDPMI